MAVIPFEVHETAIADLFTVQMKQVEDERGRVREFYRESAFRDAGLPSLGPWLQVNLTESKRGPARRRAAQWSPSSWSRAPRCLFPKACATASSRSAKSRRNTCTASTTSGCQE